jgi:phospholipid-translocating ATPase
LKGKKGEEAPVCYKLRRFFGTVVSREKRSIRLNGQTDPGRFPSNHITNTKYNLLTLIPLVLYNQFRLFFNFFFLVIALSQFITVLKVGFIFTYVAPLVFVLAVTIMKEGWDDYMRFLRDKELNGGVYDKLLKDGNFKPMISSKLKVGDIIRVNQNERIPADICLLYTTDKNRTIFIRTDQLDGETDWKLRKPIQTTQDYKPTENLHKLVGRIMA